MEEPYFVSNETYKMTEKPVTQKQTGSAFDATVIRSYDRAGVHKASGEVELDVTAFSGHAKPATKAKSGTFRAVRRPLHSLRCQLLLRHRRHTHRGCCLSVVLAPLDY